MLIPGLASVTFRNEKPETILWHAKQSGLKCIEWGGDIHVPVGDLGVAEAVKRMTVNEGLINSSYGSYYRIGVNKTEEFSNILCTASQLETNNIRIWGGEIASNDIDQSLFLKMVDQTKIICEMAAIQNTTLSLECHIGTITDDYKSSIRFIESVNKPNLKMYWQPNHQKSEEYNLQAVKELLPLLSNVHVFHWDTGGNRFPLALGEEIWQKYLDVLNSDGKDHNLLLEFMHDGELDSLEETAKTLLSWV